MAQEFTIELVVDEDGNVSLEVQGVQGSLCELATAWVDVGELEEDRKTEDYHKRPALTASTKGRRRQTLA